jgi:AcrR family transcriptional regulator
MVTMAEKRVGKTTARESSRTADDLDSRIVDTAIDLAEEMGWGNVRLRDVANRLNIPLAELRTYYRDLDAVADAWFTRAMDAMLAPPPRNFFEQPVKTRLFILLMRWFDALAPHRRVTGQMVREKLYPAHPHHWVPMIFNLSRTIQLLRDAAALDAGGRRRQVEETGLSALFLATFSVWTNDQTPNQKRTRAFLQRRLDGADRTIARLFGSS